MRIILLTLLALKFSFCSAQFETKIKTKDFELKGNVYSSFCITYNSEERFGDPFILDKVLSDFLRYPYSENYLAYFDRDKKITKLLTILNVTDKKEIERVIKTDSLDQLFYNKTIYEYNNLNQLKEKSKTKHLFDYLLKKDVSIKMDTTKYKYDTEGNLIQEDIFNSNRTEGLSYRTKFTYEKSHITEYLYNSNGKIIYGTKTISDNNVRIDTTFMLDTLKKITSYNTTEQNEIGQIVNEKNYSVNNILETELIYQFNSKNLIESKKLINHQKNEFFVISFTYKYDEIGNWIQKNVYDNGVLKMTLQRIIKYY